MHRWRDVINYGVNVMMTTLYVTQHVRCDVCAWRRCNKILEQHIDNESLRLVAMHITRRHATTQRSTDRTHWEGLHAGGIKHRSPAGLIMERDITTRTALLYYLNHLSSMRVSNRRANRPCLSTSHIIDVPPSMQQMDDRLGASERSTFDWSLNDSRLFVYLLTRLHCTVSGEILLFVYMIWTCYGALTDSGEYNRLLACQFRCIMYANEVRGFVGVIRFVEMRQKHWQEGQTEKL